MSNEVTKIINTLCEKLGVAASVLIPEIAKKEIAQDATVVIVCTVIIVAMFIMIRVILRKMNNDRNDMFDKFIALLAPVVAVFIAWGVWMIFIVDLAGWIASPTAMAIEQITRMIK